MRTGSGQADDPPAAGQQADPARAGPGGMDRIGVGHDDHLVEQLAVEHCRHETSTDTLDAMLTGPAAGEDG